MKITKWSEKDGMSGKGMMVEVTQQEALKIIESLSVQMLKGSPNNGRAEMYTTDTHEYVSIAVVKE